MTGQWFLSTLPVGGATLYLWQTDKFQRFLSTLPVGGATWNNFQRGDFHLISIHAPRGGSDSLKWPKEPARSAISIHAPRGGSDFSVFFYPIVGHKFLSTLPVGGATANMIIFHSYLQQFIMQSDNFFWNQQFKSNFMRVFAKFLNRYIYFSKSSSASLLRNLCLLPFRTGTNKKVFWWYYFHLNKMV